MRRYSKIILPALMWIASMPAYASTLSEAEIREWCDSSPLAPIEGIWEYPDDGARVLIKADETKTGTYTITILDTPDCRLEQGDIIGHLHPTIDNRQFRLEQYTKKENPELSGPYSCTATLSSDGEAIRVKSPKIKLRINLNTLLPRFWRVVRMSVDNPAEALPAGLVKVYPGYDHNGSLRRKKRIL